METHRFEMSANSSSELASSSAQQAVWNHLQMLVMVVTFVCFVSVSGFVSLLGLPHTSSPI